ncbi:MAG: ribosome-binding factor A [Acidimicrobiales bacterium]
MRRPSRRRPSAYEAALPPPRDRMARVNSLLQRIVAEELSRLSVGEPELDLMTVTGVSTEPGLHTAVVYLSSVPGEGLPEPWRVGIQAAIASQARLRRTPRLSFVVDPAITNGEKIEGMLRAIGSSGGPDSDGRASDGRASDGRASDGRASDGRASDGRASDA